MIRYTILVGTMTGTAQMVADDVASVLQHAGHDVEVLRMDEVGLEVFGREGRIILCTSTYGFGDVPDNAAPLLDALEGQRPDLAGVQYSVFGLGDSAIYAQTHCFGGRRFDDLLASLGATRFAPARFHDAASGVNPWEVGAEWARGFDAAGLDHAA